MNVHTSTTWAGGGGGRFRLWWIAATTPGGRGAPQHGHDSSRTSLLAVGGMSPRWPSWSFGRGFRQRGSPGVSGTFGFTQSGGAAGVPDVWTPARTTGAGATARASSAAFRAWAASTARTSAATAARCAAASSASVRARRRSSTRRSSSRRRTVARSIPLLVCRSRFSSAMSLRRDSACRVCRRAAASRCSACATRCPCWVSCASRSWTYSGR